MMDIFFLTVFSIAFQVLIVLSVNHDSSCMSKDVNLNHLGTKTPYRFAFNKNDSVIHFPGCEPVRMWSVIRHGTRYPGTKTILQMREYLPRIRDQIVASNKKGQGKLCKDELSAFMQWKPIVELPDQKFLTHEGEEEMLNLGERFQRRFPDLLPEHYSNDTFKFQFTASQRTRESARYFTIGLFGKRVSKYVWYPEPLRKDPILRFYKLCPKWKTEVDKNPDSLYEREMFENGPETQGALKEITEHLGLNHTISVDDAALMYVTCSFETAWNKWKASPWCAAFSEESLKVFEYAEDLEYYWIDGYGYNLTYMQACPAVRDMLLYLKDGHISGMKQKPHAVFYFTHSGTLLKLMAHFGMYKDEVTLSHKDYGTLGDTRKWRVSYIDPFGTNLAFVLFKCGQKHKVLILHQEKTVFLPGCPRNELCPLDTLLNLYDKSINSCNFDEMCNVSPS